MFRARLFLIVVFFKRQNGGERLLLFFPPYFFIGDNVDDSTANGDSLYTPTLNDKTNWDVV